MRLTEKKVFNNFFETFFDKHFSQFFSILRFSVKEIGFPSLRGDFFVSFDHMDLTRFLLDCRKYLISVFPPCASFRNFHLVKEYPLAFIVDFGLRKEVLRAETRFAIIELYRKKIKKLDFVIPVG